MFNVPQEGEHSSNISGMGFLMKKNWCKVCGRKGGPYTIWGEAHIVYVYTGQMLKVVGGGFKQVPGTIYAAHQLNHSKWSQLPSRVFLTAAIKSLPQRLLTSSVGLAKLKFQSTCILLCPNWKGDKILALKIKCFVLLIVWWIKYALL